MKINDACGEILESLEKRPSAIMICITCVDALLGTDMERICRKVTEKYSIPCVACYMYALTREKRLSPMAYVRTSVYSLLENSVFQVKLTKTSNFHPKFHSSLKLRIEN